MMGVAELVADNQLLRSMLQNIVADSGKVKQAHRQANDGIDRILVRVHALGNHRSTAVYFIPSAALFPRTFVLS